MGSFKLVRSKSSACGGFQHREDGKGKGRGGTLENAVGLFLASENYTDYCPSKNKKGAVLHTAYTALTQIVSGRLRTTHC